MQGAAALLGKVGESAGGGGQGEGASNQRGVVPQLGLLAMIAAREDGCDCRACQALRRQVDVMFDTMLKGVASNAGGESPAPAPNPGP